MSNLSKKVLSATLTATTALTMSGLLLVATPAAAQSTSDLQAQIAALLAQIAQLQAQLNQSGGGGSATSCNFTRDLTVGSTGADVTDLQKFLNGHGAQIAASGAGSPGNESNHFGSLTRAALAKWQAANGVSPAAGYFGPITRAKVNSQCTGAVPGPSQPPVVSGSVTITPGANVGGSIISGAAQVPVLNFTVTNGTNAEVAVTNAKFTKTGVLSDSNISNAYISEGSNIIAQYTGLTNGVIQFTGNVVTIPAGQSKQLTLRVDISTGTSNGNLVSFALMNAADLVVSAGSVGGSFPLQGGSFTTTSVTNPSLASISSLAYQGVANTVDAGTLGFRASALSFTVQNSPIKLTGIKFTISGSLNWQSDLRNAVLKLDGIQVGTGVVSPDGKVFFDMGANPPSMSTGSHQLEVYVDVLGTANRLMTWQLLRPFEWTLVDTQYNSNLSGGTPTGTATQTSVRPGQSTISLASDTPTGNIPIGSSNFTIAKFVYVATGEPVKFKWMPFRITQSGSVTAWNSATPPTAVDADIRNIALYADDGTQVGTTINTPSSCTYGTPEATATTYICSFGSPTSNVNYIIPANTTRVFSLRVDVQSGADVVTLKGSVIAPSNTNGFQGSNLEGQISFQTNAAPGGTIDGSALTVVNNPFTANRNTALSNQSMVSGSYGAKIASFSLGASSAEGIRLTSVSLQTSASTTSSGSINGPLRMQNLQAKIGSTALNYNIPSVDPSTTYTFSVPSGTTLVPPGGTIIVDVFGDVLQSSATSTFTSPISLTSAVGTGNLTNTNQILKTTAGAAISASSPLAGQNLTIGGNGALTLNGVSNDPVITQFVKGATGVILWKGQLRETTNNEAIRIITIQLTASSTNSAVTASPFQNLTLVDWSGNAIPGAGPVSFNASTTAGVTVASFSPTNMTVGANQTVIVGLKGDITSDENFFQANNGTKWIFRINSVADVTAVGVGSAATIVPTGAGTATNSSEHQAVGAKLAISSFTKQPSVVINNSSDLKVAQATFTTSGSAGTYAVLKTLRVTASGPAMNAVISPVIYLRDPGDVVLATTTVSSSTAATFTIPTSTTSGRVYQGSDKTFTISIDTQNMVTPSSGNTNPTLSLQIGAGSVLTDVAYATYLTESAFGESFNLDRTAPNSLLPKTVSVSYQ